jgi:antitoxin VapB
MYILKVYTSGGIMRKAKVFMSGNSQAVRLPRDFQFHSDEVSIEKKEGKIILWETPKNLSNAFNILASLPADFFSMGRQDLPPQERESF